MVGLLFLFLSINRFIPYYSALNLAFCRILWYNIYDNTEQGDMKMEQISQIPERWFSTKEMCAYLGVTRDTLLTWINEKGMPAHRSDEAGNTSPAKSMNG